ncbi:MAG TPA: AAA family ATPase [Pyrinomonadaceae bacterium]|nr:AAA family ATPase [Pyrinomonadaceae bacterium]
MASDSGLSSPGGAAPNGEVVGEGMTLVVLHGLPASGKLTVARELSRLTGYKLFHNHLTVDLLLSVFEFASPPFARLRELIWTAVIREAAAAGLPGLIFTFTPERSVSEDFLRRLKSEAEAAGASVRLVALVCPEQEVENRLQGETRKSFGKLQSVELFRELRAEGFFTMPDTPESELVVDTSELTPRQSADAILAALRLPAAGGTPPA